MSLTLFYIVNIYHIVWSYYCSYKCFIRLLAQRLCHFNLSNAHSIMNTNFHGYTNCSNCNISTIYFKIMEAQLRLHLFKSCLLWNLEILWNLKNANTSTSLNEHNFHLCSNNVFKIIHLVYLLQKILVKLN